MVFEELEVGGRWTGTSRTITDAEMAMLPAMMGASNPLFHDEVTAGAGPFGGRVLYGPALLGIAVGLTEPLFGTDARGIVAMDELRFIAPVHVGDTITARFTVEALRPSSRRPTGRATIADEVLNQRGETVLTLKRTLLVRMRDGG